MIKHLFYSALAPMHRNQGIKRLRHLEKKLVSPRARFAVPFAYRGSGYFKLIEPRQNSIEIEQLYDAVCGLNAQRVLEIGTARGGTLYLWAQAAAANATLVSVDLPGGEFGGAYPACRVPFYESFARPGQRLHLLRMDSHQPEALVRVRDLFDGQAIDFAFIDGDHTYEGVRADFRMYAPLVRPGGMVAFHDILPRPDLPDIQVDRFWAELRERYDCTEFIGPDGSGRRIGIGLLRVGASPIAAD